MSVFAWLVRALWSFIETMEFQNKILSPAHGIRRALISSLTCTSPGYRPLFTHMRPRKNPFQPLHFHYMARNGILSSTFRIIIRTDQLREEISWEFPVLPRRIIPRSPVFLVQRYKPDTKDFSNIEHARG